MIAKGFGVAVIVFGLAAAVVVVLVVVIVRMFYGFIVIIMQQHTWSGLMAERYRLSVSSKGGIGNFGSLSWYWKVFFVCSLTELSTILILNTTKVLGVKISVRHDFF